MPVKNPPGPKTKYDMDDDGKSFDETMTAKDGTKLMVRKETHPAFTHDGKGGKGTAVYVPETMTSRRVPVSSKPPSGKSHDNLVTPGKWHTKEKI